MLETMLKAGIQIYKKNYITTYRWEKNEKKREMKERKGITDEGGGGNWSRNITRNNWDWELNE